MSSQPSATNTPVSAPVPTSVGNILPIGGPATPLTYVAAAREATGQALYEVAVAATWSARMTLILDLMIDLLQLTLERMRTDLWPWIKREWSAYRARMVEARRQDQLRRQAGFAAAAGAAVVSSRAIPNQAGSLNGSGVNVVDAVGNVIDAADLINTASGLMSQPEPESSFSLGALFDLF